MGGITLPAIKASYIYISTVIETVQYWQKEKHTVQKNRIQNLETDPQKYAQLFFF